MLASRAPKGAPEAREAGAERRAGSTPRRGERGRERRGARAKERGLTALEALVGASIAALILALGIATVDRSQAIAQVATTRADVEQHAQRAAVFMADRLRQSGSAPGAGLALAEPVGGLGLVNEVGDPLAAVGGATGGLLGGATGNLLGGTLGVVGEVVEDAADALGLGADHHHRIVFRLHEGTDPATGLATWSEPRALGFAYEAGEATGGTTIGLLGGLLALDAATPNGRDDDGDGLVDEGVLYYETTEGGTARREVLARDALPASGFRLVEALTSLAASPGSDTVLVRVEVARRLRGERGTLASAPHQFVHVVLETRVALRNAAAGGL